MRVWALVVAVLLCAAPPAAAGTLPSGPDPLPGSTFQGGDGDQEDAAQLIDWQGLQEAGRVVHNADLNAPDTVFAGGSKLLEPGSWQLDTEPGGASPGKNNILDAWSVVDQPAGDTYLYLSYTRADATGTAAITFELNRDSRL